MKFLPGLLALGVAVAFSYVSGDQVANSTVISKLVTAKVVESQAGIGYVAGIRSTRGGDNFCTGALIGPAHVLTITSCIPNKIRWVSLGSPFYRGENASELFKVVAFLMHPNNTDYQNDFLILELEKETSISPVRLDSTKSIVKTDMIGARLGWNDTSAPGVRSHYLQAVQVQLISNDMCATELTVDSSHLCSRGVSAIKSCSGDKGGPVVVRKKNHDVLVGLVTGNKGCGTIGGLSVYARIAAVRSWIDSVTKTYCVAT
ncbi:hypothetical protein PsorP6_016831 [Peronosclerospora sorghi]|uniref:Uncharacterized protein n=1 Tax=Peronosclerospora sorghi TaxID=230839 RepID=A0ACC0WGX0_9STRA|nr:hypothetical protein PsorP6_016831 [Peronosclerospora sorghi]